MSSILQRTEKRTEREENRKQETGVSGQRSGRLMLNIWNVTARAETSYKRLQKIIRIYHIPDEKRYNCPFGQLYRRKKGKHNEVTVIKSINYNVCAAVFYL